MGNYDYSNNITSLSLLPNYSQNFLNSTSSDMNNINLSTGLINMGSNDLATAYNGYNMAQNAFEQSSYNPFQGEDLISEIFLTQDPKISFADKFSNSTFGKNYNAWNTGLNLANNVVTGIFGQKNEYQGDSGQITQTMDSIYDTIQTGAAAFGPVGQAVSLIMGANKFLGNTANKLGAGTDGMTTTDAVLGSAFMQMTPLGLINGAFGRKSDKFNKDYETFEKIGSSYSGSEYLADQALSKSNKKYGLFSSGSRRNANNQISEANRQQNLLSGIADEATTRFLLADSMAAINNNKYALDMQGGYNQAGVQYGRLGLKLTPIQARKILNKFKTGGQVDQFQEYINSLPKNQQDSTNFRVREYWEYSGRPKDFEEAKQKNMFKLQEDFDQNGKSLGQSWHANSVAENPITGEIEFMKSPDHPTIKYEIEWYNSDSPDAVEFRKNYELQKSLPYWKYVKRVTPLHKEGGTIIELVIEPTEFIPINDTPEFQEGGEINVIPDGALHARKHHMDMEGITPKGIPVVSNKEGGEVEQQAEIEREEIIYRKAVTEELEKLCKIYYSEETSQKEKDEAALKAGKLLVKETLYNTIDNTGKLL